MNDEPKLSNVSLAQPAPSQEMRRDPATLSATRQDTNGRNITVRKPTPLDVFRLTKIYGRKAEEATLNMATVASAVTHIDGDPVSPPSSDRQIEFLIERLGFEGMAAASEAIAAIVGDNAAADLDAVKN